MSVSVNVHERSLGRRDGAASRCIHAVAYYISRKLEQGVTFESAIFPCKPSDVQIPQSNVESSSVVTTRWILKRFWHTSILFLWAVVDEKIIADMLIVRTYNIHSSLRRLELV
jgi:hypothetical protein